MANLGQMRVLDLTLGISYCPGKPPKTLTGIVILGAQKTKTNNFSSANMLSVCSHIGGIPWIPTGLTVTGSSFKFIENKPAYRDNDVTCYFFGMSFGIIGSSTSRSG